MRKSPNLKANRFREREFSLDSDGNNGVFIVPHHGMVLRVIASDGGGWDHVSVSLPHRCPTWKEMCAVKELFFRDDEAVMQLHPAKSEWINDHPYCLHLWRPQELFVPLPPRWMVSFTGLKNEEVAEMRTFNE